MSTSSKSPDHVRHDHGPATRVVVWAFRRSTNRLVPSSR